MHRCLSKIKTGVGASRDILLIGTGRTRGICAANVLLFCFKKLVQLKYIHIRCSAVLAGDYKMACLSEKFTYLIKHQQSSDDMKREERFIFTAR